MASGIDVDLAPVADVASVDRFVHVSATAGRGRSVRSTTASLADAFASGLESTGVVPSMKHFPGLGFATQNTDA